MSALFEESSETLCGEVQKIDYKAEESAFAVVSIRCNDTPNLVSAIGPLGHLTPGVIVTLQGKWTFTPNYGEQFEAKSSLIENPKTIHGLQLYLIHQMKGVGKKTAQRIVEKFGVNTLTILNESPHLLSTVQGISINKAEVIANQWREDVQNRETLITLRSFGFGTQLALRIVRKYGSETLKQVMEHPYSLCENFRGIGFQTADKIALQNGIEPHNPVRIEAIIQHCLKSAEQDGHCYVEQNEMIEKALTFDIPQQLILDTLNQALSREKLSMIEKEDKNVYLARPLVYFTERKIAQQLKNRIQYHHTFPKSIPLNYIPLDESGLNIEQRTAVEAAFCHGVSILTGGPGTGKTTTLKSIIDVSEQSNEKWYLAAPTGRAAKRISESTGTEAQTIHRLLKINEAGIFQHNAENPLDCAGLIIDEASMLDIWLMNAVLNALPPNARLVLMGDVHQLPSVGTGQVLKDLIDSQEIPVTILHQIYRQAEDSNIIRNAHTINQGKRPASSEVEEGNVKKDFFILDRETQEETLHTLCTIVQQKIPRLGYNFQRDVQILTPMHSGILGTSNINRVIQEMVNPKGQACDIQSKQFRVGDRVIQMKNDYELGIFNGDVGTIQKMVDSTVFVEFDGLESSQKNDTSLHLSYPKSWIAIPFSQMGSMELAYAITIHKSQGSEYPVVLMVIHKSHWVMLRRNLVYTAITRAKEFCCIIGSRWALHTAIDEVQTEATSNKSIRCTHLSEWLRQI